MIPETKKKNVVISPTELRSMRDSCFFTASQRATLYEKYRSYFMMEVGGRNLR